jgi:hypothetical protein
LATSFSAFFTGPVALIERREYDTVAGTVAGFAVRTIGGTLAALWLVGRLGI